MPPIIVPGVPQCLSLLRITTLNRAEQSNRRVKRNDQVFITPLFQLEHFPYAIIPEKKEQIIPLKTSAYSIIPRLKMALFHSYQKKTFAFNPLFLFTHKSRTSHVKSFRIRINGYFFVLCYRLGIQTKTVSVKSHQQDLIKSQWLILLHLQRRSRSEQFS